MTANETVRADFCSRVYKNSTFRDRIFSLGESEIAEENEWKVVFVNRFISQPGIITRLSGVNNKINHSLVKASVIPTYANGADFAAAI